VLVEGASILIFSELGAGPRRNNRTWVSESAGIAGVVRRTSTGGIRS